MPVSVNVPIRVRVDPGALVRRQCCIEDALSAALSRALIKSSEIVLGERGGYASVQLHGPAIRWTGDAVGCVPQGVRQATTDRIVAAWAKCVDDAGILTPASKRNEPAAPLPDGIRESVDPDRYAPLLGRYLIPSYDGPRRKIAAKVGTKTPTAAMKSEGSSATIVRFKIRGRHWDEIDYVFELYEQALEYDADNPQLPMSGPGIVGLIFSHYAGGYEIAFYDVPNPRRVLVQGKNFPTFTYLKAGIHITRLGAYQAATGKGRLSVSVKEGGLALASSYHLRWYPATTPAARRAFTEAQLRAILPERFSLERKNLGKVTDAQFATWVNQAVAEQIAAIKDNPTTRSFVTLEIGGSVHWFVELSIELPNMIGRGPILVLPRTEEVAKPKAKKKAAAAAAAPAETRGGASTGSSPIGPSGIEGRRNPPAGDPNAPNKDCADDYSTRYSAANPEHYVDDSDFQKNQPLLGEPALVALLNDGVPLQGWIDRLAAEIGIQPYSYAGNFCLAAGTAIAARARRLGDDAASDVATAGILKPTNQGNLGFVQFDPQSTPAVRQLHDLARMLDDVIELGNRTQSVYRYWWPNLCGRWYQYEHQWGLAFDTLFHPIKNDAVSNLFKAACRVLMLQLLESSKSQIEARKKNLANYAPVFEYLLRAYFTEKSELEKLKAKLERGKLLASLTAAPDSPSSGSWLTLRAGLGEALRQSEVTAPASVTIRDGLVYRGDTPVGVQDENGVFWTAEALEQALTQREFLVESIDPLIKQISNDEADFILATLNQKHGAVQFTVEQLIKGGDLGQAIFERIRNEQKVTTGIVVEAILDTLLSNNATEVRRTRASFEYAFKSAPLYSGGRSYRIPYCSFELMGIHKLADEQIGSAFRSNPQAYGWELNDVLSALAGGRSLTRFFTFAGLVVLSVICPPLGAALAAATAIIDYRAALEKKALFRSLIDPDLVITRAEVEAELFAAELGLVLSFVPEAGAIIGRAARGFTIVVEQGGARAVMNAARRTLTLDGAQAAAAALRNRFSAAIAERLKDGLAQAIAVEFVKAEVMNELLAKLLIEPVIDGIYQDFKDYSQGARGPGAVVRVFGKDVP